MDILKTILDFCKKYLFWFLFAATVVLVLVFWWMSTKSLASSFKLQQDILKKKFDEVEAIVNNQQHPTQEYIKAVKNEDENGKLKDCKLKELKEGVLAVWQTLYDKQKENNHWPSVLGDQFVKKFDMLGPNDKIPDPLRERYINVIKRYFKDVLYKIIDLRQPPETAEAGGGGVDAIRQLMASRTPQIGRGRTTVTAAESANWIGVVDWDDNDRERLELCFDWKTPPDSDVIRLRQEDLWVYETLLRIIRDTNGESHIKKDDKGNAVMDDKGNPVMERVYAKDHSQAAVKRIEWIQIGADAINSWSLANQSVFKASEAAPDAQAPAASRDSRTAATTTPAATAAQDSKELLLKDRYVDDKGVPLEADAKQFAEFKMMPISMKLHMDQRKISKLLAECVNSPMPVDVRRVRIRPGAGERLEPETSAAADSGTPGRDYSRKTLNPYATARAWGVGTGDEEETGPYDVPVEIQGVIYIYNQADQSTLGTGTAGEKPAETASAATDPAKP